MNAALISMTAPCSSQTKNASCRESTRAVRQRAWWFRSRASSTLARTRASSLRCGKRFDEVVVGAGLQAFDGGFLAGARRQQENRHGGGARSRCAALRPTRVRPARASSRRSRPESGRSARTPLQGLLAVGRPRRPRSLRCAEDGPGTRRMSALSSATSTRAGVPLAARSRRRPRRRMPLSSSGSFGSARWRRRAATAAPPARRDRRSANVPRAGPVSSRRRRRAGGRCRTEGGW